METTTKQSYTEITSKQPELEECFFAFSQDQLKKGIAKNNLEGKKLLDGGGGLIGTKFGIQKLFDYYDAQSKKISENCDPQEVYRYEFSNHECSYTNDDEEAIKIVIDYFGKEIAKTVKRRFSYFKIEEK